MTEEPGTIITEGREAWARLRGRGEKTFVDWVAVGKALALGRAHCLQLAETNKPFGKRYTAAMTQWLDSNGLDDVHQQERWWSLKVIDRLAEIEGWRATLDEASRRRFNHPQSIWDNWRRAQAHEARRCSRSTRVSFKRHPRADARPIYWGQDHLRRAAAAIRECRSVDCIILARAALEAAIQNEADLFQLLERAYPPARPAKVRPSAMAEAVA